MTTDAARTRVLASVAVIGAALVGRMLWSGMATTTSFNEEQPSQELSDDEALSPELEADEPLGPTTYEPPPREQLLERALAPEPKMPEPGSAEEAEMKAAEQAEIEAGLAHIERIRAIPGAAPLVDDIVEYLKTAPEEEFSLSNLPTDENGLAKVGPDATQQMIKDPTIRAKWDQLMVLVQQANL